MAVPGCMKSLLLAAPGGRDPPNAALLQHGLEVRAAPCRGSRAAAGRRGRACACGRGVPSGLWAWVVLFGPRPRLASLRPAAGCRRPGVPAWPGPRPLLGLSAWQWGHSPGAGRQESWWACRC